MILVWIHSVRVYAYAASIVLQDFFPKCRGRLKTNLLILFPSLHSLTYKLVDSNIEIPLNMIDDPDMIHFRTAWWNVIDKVKEYA